MMPLAGLNRSVLIPLLIILFIPGPPAVHPLDASSTPSQGKFLVASRGMGDPRFAEAVVLLVRYGRHGAMGLIINRPTKVRLSEVLPGIEGLRNRTDPLYFGGPVSLKQMQLLIRSPSPLNGAERVFNGVYVSASRKVLERVLADGGTFRVYAGYAGWAPGQLEREISSGSWHVVDADAETVFERPAAEVWPELINRASVIHVDLRG